MDDGLADLLHRVVATFGDLARRRIASGPGQLTYTQIRIIGTLEEAPGMTQRELADSVGLSEAAMSRALRALRDEGLVDIVVDPTHARRRLATATAEGLRHFHDSGAAIAGQLREWLIREGFPYDRYLADSQQLADLLGPLNRAAPPRASIVATEGAAEGAVQGAAE
ncbi:winged helix-turn-helix transcriptional regulator [Mycetocola tolaasinivorans]|uniref:Winged helix-turn-helix transcriptional regulator n=1 Tax=Mycetocola tolaasinivorans TaxID=76635 RepID=A0A3L7A3W7_9MICO|nr:MarR family transcriptional regulator [Mycetocola tolaasinivorans]RLP74979.1 winged helix-turn-helix transcriptional regulator [Mycetocola tolaasinivorans]